MKSYSHQPSGITQDIMFGDIRNESQKKLAERHAQSIQKGTHCVLKYKYCMLFLSLF